MTLKVEIFIKKEILFSVGTKNKTAETEVRVTHPIIHKEKSFILLYHLKGDGYGGIIVYKIPKIDKKACTESRVLIHFLELTSFGVYSAI